MRPHHAFCILNYRQSGYSEEFVENMTAIVENLRADTKIEIVSTSDAVCKACPNRTEPTPGDDVCCRCADKVRRYDAEALNFPIALKVSVVVRFHVTITELPVHILQVTLKV